MAPSPPSPQRQMSERGCLRYLDIQALVLICNSLCAFAIKSVLGADDKAHWMSFGHHFHKIIYDPTDQNVKVSIFRCVPCHVLPNVWNYSTCTSYGLCRPHGSHSSLRRPKDYQPNNSKVKYSYVLLPLRRTQPSTIECTFSVQSKDAYSWCAFLRRKGGI